jgi:hypothetical protein
MEDAIRKAIVAELKRQASESPQTLEVEPQDDALAIDGRVDLDSLTMAIVGEIAGGP